MDEIRICKTEKGEIEYLLQGEGPLVLFIHGGHSSCLARCGQQSLLDNGFSVLTPSRPGYKGTPIQSGKTVEATADLLAALLKTLKIEKVTVIGISAGGPTALVFAERFPDLIEKLILESAVVKPWFHKLKVEYYVSKVIFHPARQKQFWKKLRQNLEQNEKKTLLKNLKIFTNLNPKEALQRLSDEDIQLLKEDMVTGNDSGSGFVYDIEHRAGKLEKISCPTLIIHSKNDGCLPFSHAEYAHMKIKNSELFVAPTDSHFLYFGPGSKEVLQKRLEFLLQRKVAHECTAA